jgi:beta-glucosidase
VLELRRFQRVALEPGAETRLRFELARADFGFLDAALQPTVEPGEIEVHLGFSADPDALSSTRFTLG